MKEIEKMMREVDRILLSMDSSSLESMTASQINRALDKADKARSDLTDRFIAEGRGNERPSETFSKTDPLSERFKRLFDKYTNLRNEVSRRYGPGAPSRLPTRR